ncbi:MAG: hypothetical protein HDT39_15405 [Lachnospiraceae bacterium]|nr:hypothetical protein [Lachnospiraceae bacterium]
MLYSEMLFTLVQFYLAWFILIVVLNMPFFDRMSKRAQSRFFLICAIVHAVCAIGYFEFNENKLNYIKTEGTVISKYPIEKKRAGISYKGSKLEKQYYVYEVEYSAEGKSYCSKHYETLEYIFKPGKKVVVYYKKSNPKEIWEGSLDVSIRIDLYGNMIFVLIFLIGYITHRQAKREEGKES